MSKKRETSGPYKITKHLKGGGVETAGFYSEKLYKAVLALEEDIKKHKGGGHYIAWTQEDTFELDKKIKEALKHLPGLPGKRG